MKIIILLSVYNGAHYIDQQLESIYKQDTEAEIEIYVRDDGSIDNTREIINTWANRLHIIWANSSQNLGVAQSFMYLMHTAPEADYYAYCDQDDYWHENKLSRAFKQMKEYGQTIPLLYFSNSRLVDKNLKPLNITTSPVEPMISISAQLVCGNCQGSTMIMNQNLCRLLREKNIKHIIMHDLTTMLYAIAWGKVIYDNESTMDYRQHDGNVESTLNKSLSTRFHQTYRRWIKNKGIMSKQVEELLEKCRGQIKGEDIEFCNKVKLYKHNIFAKIYLFKIAPRYSIHKAAIRSFRLRVLCNLY
jgi:glycosyltransferase involved in cell wall biosynthesis